MAAERGRSGGTYDRILSYQRVRADGMESPTTFWLVGGLNFFIGALVGAQYLARELGYHENLGAPWIPAGAVPPETAWLVIAGGVGGAALLARSAATLRWVGIALLAVAAGGCLLLGPVYSPLQFVYWVRIYFGEPELKPLVREAINVACGGMVVGILATGPVLMRPRTKRVSVAHGSAEITTGDQFLLPEKEERLFQREWHRYEHGRVLIGRHRNGRLLWDGTDRHILVLAPTRTGKGVSSVLTNLLLCRNPMVVTDPKGENFAVSYRRRLAMGHKVVVLDPFRITGQHEFHATCNVLKRVDVVGANRDRDRDEAQKISEMILPDTASQKDPHWNIEGRALMTGLILHIRTEAVLDPSEDATADLIRMRELLLLPEEQFEDLLKQMSISPHPLVRGAAARLLQKDSRERSGVISTVHGATDFLDSVPLRRVLRSVPAREFDAQELKADRPVTVYVVIPSDMLTTHGAFMRLMISLCNDALQVDRRPAKQRIVFLLDEFANLGFLRPVLDGISLVGGYGAKFILYVQDLAQLKDLYKEKTKTLFANSYLKIVFGTNDDETAKLISSMIGDTTVFTESGSHGGSFTYGARGSHGTNTSQSTSEKGRKLLMPEEVMRLRPEEQLLIVAMDDPILTTKACYYEDAEFFEQAPRARRWLSRKPVRGKAMFDRNPMVA